MLDGKSPLLEFPAPKGAANEASRHSPQAEHTLRRRSRGWTGALAIAVLTGLLHLANPAPGRADDPPALVRIQDPFEDISLSKYAAPACGDLDGDGDPDVLVGGQDGDLAYFLNIGSSDRASFEEQTGSNNPLDGEDIGGFSQPATADLDGDLDLDLVIGAQDGSMFYYENIGGVNAPVFIRRLDEANPLDGVDIGDFSAPALADIDGDGDADLFIGAQDGRILFYRNVGTTEAPVFESQTGSDNPLDQVDVGSYAAPILADLDNDGDFDALIGERNGLIRYYENIGTCVTPVFTARSGEEHPLDGEDVGWHSVPALLDIDGDGDWDALVADHLGAITSFENIGDPGTPAMNSFIDEHPLHLVQVLYYSAPAFVDIDGDGDLDCFVGEIFGTVRYYENVGTAIAPEYAERTGAGNPLDLADVVANSIPAFVDIDGDGDFDVFLGNEYGTLTFYENIGTAGQPNFVLRSGQDNPLDPVQVAAYSTPCFVDIDHDGDPDLFVGEGDGAVKFFLNVGTAQDPNFIAKTGPDNPLGQVDVGFYSAPVLADIDGDGDPDAFIGSTDGTVRYYENIGNDTTPDFVERSDSENPLSGQVVGYDAVPALADLDGDGDLDAFIGEYAGKIRYYRNDQFHLNHEPTTVILTTSGVLAGKPVGTTVGTLVAYDPDPGDQHAFSLVAGEGSDDNASFTIDGQTLLTADIFDYDHQYVYRIRVRATDSGGLFVEKTLIIYVIQRHNPLFFLPLLLS